MFCGSAAIAVDYSVSPQFPPESWQKLQQSLLGYSANLRWVEMKDFFSISSQIML